MQFDPLPATLAIAKPRGQEAYKPEVLLQLQERGALIGTRKSDGHQLRAEVCTGRRVRLYTRRMHQVDNRLDYIRQEIADAHLPVGTVLLGELVIRDVAGHDDEGAVGSLMASAKQRANAFLGRGSLPSFVLFNLLHPSRGALAGVPYHQALLQLESMFPQPAYVTPVRALAGRLDDMVRIRENGDWEGLVLYDRDYVLQWRLRGNAATPHGCYKLKPHAEDDFIVFRRHRALNGDGSLYDVALLQWDPIKHKLFYCGRLGAFDAQMKAKLSADDWDVFVMQVRYVRRWPKRGTLREPAFVRLRDPRDKDPDSCIAPRSWPEAEYVK